MKRKKNSTQILIISICLFCSVFHSNVSFSQVVYQEPIELSSRTIDINKPVGITAGSAEVTPDGAATYNIPIFCPPGTAGMQPSLAISYSSKGSYGCLGWGWDIVGLSAISRDSKTLIQDGQMKSVAMANGDAYSLDGNRLILSSTGQGFSVYYTEQATFYTIKSFGSSGSGPDYFTVTFPDGSIREYGNSSDSKTMKSDDNSGTIGIWRVNKITDINGNYITFQYNSTSGLIYKIFYTGTLTSAPYNEIEFVYSQRDDKNMVYNGYSAPIYDYWLLTDIEVKNNSSLVKKYSFKFEKEDEDVYSLLNEVVEADGNGNNLNSTVFTWGDKINPNTGFEFLDITSDLFCPKQVVVAPLINQFVAMYWGPWTSGHDHDPWTSKRDKTHRHIVYEYKLISTPQDPIIWFEMPGDYNGDGHTDKFQARNIEDETDPTKIEWKLLLWDQAAMDFASPVTGEILNHNPAKDLVLMQLTSADYNDNLLDEIFLTVWDERKSGTGNLPDSVDIKSFVFNGTGLDSCNFGIKNLSARGLVEEYENMEYYVEFLDLDGDQRQDEIILNYFGTYETAGFYMNGLPISSIWPPVTGNPDLTINLPGDKYTFIDFNGNGISDILKIVSTTTGMDYNIYEYNNTSFALIASFQVTGTNVGDSIFPGDFNGDGKTDLLMFNDATNLWSMNFSKGDQITQISSTVLINDLNANEYVHMIPSDYNGDGKTDVFLTSWDGNSETYEAFIYYSYGKDFIKTTLGTLQVQYHAMTGIFSIFPCGDMNGDGNDDLVMNCTEHPMGGAIEWFSHLCYINEDVKPLLLKTCTNGFNQTVQFSYKPLSDHTVHTKGTNSDSRIINFDGPMYVVSQVTQPTGVGGRSTTSYLYEGALMHKYGLGFLGFTKVTDENNITGLKNVANYSFNTDYLSMPLISASSFINTSPVSTVQYTNNFIALSGSNGHGYYKQIFPYITITASTDHLTNTTTYKEDYYGGSAGMILTYQGAIQSDKIYYGSMSTPDGWIENAYTYSTYGFTLPDSRVVSLVKLDLTTNRKFLGGQAPSQLTNTYYTYYSNSRLETATDYWLTSGAITNTFEYTACGNVSEKRSSATGLDDRFVNYEYDSKDRYVSDETDMLNRIKSYTYNEVFGKPVTAEDIAGNITQAVYDNFGNTTEEELPNNVSKSYSLHWAAGSLVPHALYYSHIESDNSPEMRVYYDSIGREIYSQWTGLSDDVAAAKAYNTKGQLILETKPYYKNNGEPKEFIVTKYDNYGRVNQVKDSCKFAPTELVRTSYSYSGKTVTITDPLNNEHIKTVNNMGQLIHAEDPGGEIDYTYTETGALKSVTTGGGTITYTYDAYGRKISENDPDAGTTTFTYNYFGDITSQTDANSNTYSMTYDESGRLILKTGPEGNYTYEYIESGNGIGLVESVTGSNNYSQDYVYNALGQPTLLHENLNGEEYSFAYEYDGYGNKTSTTYPNGFSVTNTYNTFGMLVEVHRTDNENMIWQLNSQDAMGRPYYTEQGNGIITEYQYDEHNFLTKIYSDVQDDQYSWDYHTGNLTARTDDRYQLTEEFEYDALDRLNRIVMDGRDDREISYQDNGNIGSKSFVGDYQYHSAKIHAVVGIDNENNDSEICHSTQNVHYTAFHKISQIAEENETGDSLVYLYGPDMKRRKMFLFLNESSVRSRVYIGLYEKELDGYDEVTKEICYIAGGNGITAVYMNEQMYYLRRDHQGSITGLIDADGEIVEEYSYDAWGRRRNPETWNCNDAPIPQYLYRGYTFHEHMDEFGLINMNGRAYDPIVGRFLNPDPVIQNTTNTQNYNRYSYCLNNPLKYTDPSGYSYTNNERMRFKMHGINRTWESFLLKNSWNASLWKSGELGAICEALGMGGGNGLGANYTAEMDYHIGGVFWPGEIGFDPEYDRKIKNQYDDLKNAGQFEEAEKLIKDSYKPLLINTLDVVIYYKPDNTDDEYNYCGAYPLKPHESTTTRIDGISVNGVVYKVRSNYISVIVKTDGVEVSYPIIGTVQAHIMDVREFSDTLFDENGKTRNKQYPDGTWYWDRQWWNLWYVFCPLCQIPYN